MKRMFVLASVLALSLLSAGALWAQGDKQAGTWTLNVAKSKYTNMPQPKSNTRVIVPDGGGQKVSVNGTTMDGKTIAYSYTTKLDGSPAPISGTGVNEADTVVGKRVDANTITVTETKAGKLVTTATARVSKDGKVLTITSKGINPEGKPTSSATVWDRQ